MVVTISSICCVGNHAVLVARCETSYSRCLEWTLPFAEDVVPFNSVNSVNLS